MRFALVSSYSSLCAGEQVALQQYQVDFDCTELVSRSSLPTKAVIRKVRHTRKVNTAHLPTSQEKNA